MGVVESDGDTDDGNEELADQHAKSTPDEERTTSKLLNSVERERGRAHVDESKDQRDQEGVADSSSGLQEGSGVVENEVDTSPMYKISVCSFCLGLSELTIVASFAEKYPRLCGGCLTFDATENQ